MSEPRDNRDDDSDVDWPAPAPDPPLEPAEPWAYDDDDDP